MTIERIAAIEKTEKQSNPEQPVDKSAKAVDKSQAKQRSKRTSAKTAPVVEKKKPGKRGGRRPGAGRKPGKLSQKTIEKLAVKKEVENRIAGLAQKLVTAQLSVALGAQYLFVRFKVKTAKGFRWSKFERVTDPDVMQQYLDGELEDSKSEYYMLTAEKPDVSTIDSLLDRTFGRAPQNLNIKDDRPDPIAAILAKFGLLEEEGNSDDRQTKSSAKTPS